MNADGGFEYTGDIVKALYFGAQSITSGYLFAGTAECPVIEEGETATRTYRGMATIGAMKDSGAARYYQDNIPEADLVVQGIEMEVPYIGPVSKRLRDLENELKYTMSVHCGAKTIKELNKGNINFVRLR